MTIIVFFDIKGIVRHEYIRKRQAVNQKYIEVLKRLREAVRRKKPEKWRTGPWALLHDNAPSHTAHSVQWQNTASL
jgi:hypothetical protein